MSGLAALHYNGTNKKEHTTWRRRRIHGRDTKYRTSTATQKDYAIVLEKDVQVPMRDGVVLMANVFRPKHRKVSVIFYMGQRLRIASRRSRTTSASRTPGDSRVRVHRVRGSRPGVLGFQWVCHGRVNNEPRATPRANGSQSGAGDGPLTITTPWMGGRPGMVQRQCRLERFFLPRHDPMALVRQPISASQCASCRGRP